MADDAAELLLDAGQEAGHVLEGDQRDVEGVAEAHEARALGRGVDVERARQEVGLVGHDADAAAVEAGEADDDVARPVAVHLEEVAVVDHCGDDALDVVGLVGIVWHHPVERRVHPVGGVAAEQQRRVLAVVVGDERQQLTDAVEAVLVVGVGEMRHARRLVVRHRAAELLLGHLLVGHRPDHIGAGDEHVGGVLHHEDEVGDGRAVNRAARAGAHDGADLRHDAAGDCVAQEDLRVAGQADHTLLDARAAGVVEADDRHAHLHRQVHHLADLLGVGLAQRAAEDGEVLREDVDAAPVDLAEAGDDAVAGILLLLHAEVGAAVHDVAVELVEGARIEEVFDALARRQLARGVLLVDARLPAPQLGFLVPPLQFLQLVVQTHPQPPARLLFQTR